MNKINSSFLLFLFVYAGVFAQQEKGIFGNENWLDSWTNFSPNKIVYAKPTQILTGRISKDKTLLKRDIYLLVGDVFVSNNATLTIEPGTVILGDTDSKAALIVSKGSKLIAEGNATDAIIFSSNSPFKQQGDWGGIFILGNAPTNHLNSVAVLSKGLTNTTTENAEYGGNITDDTSGVLRYVRIEYAGKRTNKFGYFSALTLAGVGSKTILDHIMVSYSKGNSFTILGGDLTLNKMVSYRSSSEDYSINEGAQCRINNSLAVKSPYFTNADNYRSIAVKSFNENNVQNASQLQTNVIANNITVLNVSENLKSDIRLGLVKEAIFIDKDVSFTLNKSVISGFNPAVFLDNAIEMNDAHLEKIVFDNTYFNNCTGNIYLKNSSNNEDLESWYGSSEFNNVYYNGTDKETFINANDPLGPDFRLAVNKILPTSSN